MRLTELLAATMQPTEEEPATEFRCPHCGEELIVRRGQHSGKWMALHPISIRCELRDFRPREADLPKLRETIKLWTQQNPAPVKPPLP
jgi:hypothetical protein